MALVIFLVYFLTEVLPIFAIYLTHIWAFYSLIKRERNRLKSEASTLLPQSEYVEDAMTKEDEFRLLMANVPRSPSTSLRSGRRARSAMVNQSGDQATSQASPGPST